LLRLANWFAGALTQEDLWISTQQEGPDSGPEWLSDAVSSPFYMF
jgi:hypothetical protein